MHPLAADWPGLGGTDFPLAPLGTTDQFTSAREERGDAVVLYIPTNSGATNTWYWPARFVAARQRLCFIFSLNMVKVGREDKACFSLAFRRDAPICYGPGCSFWLVGRSFS